ncbi:hypothetical protein [Geminocystis sp. GBBB08]|uniref:hypothetical protein n=1 Tax=Geminocystis sp. GBBB08 TaxID=2604140 RepID=UPI0027E39512|nr:hypothetical protein [Geminocystis sp. GBBB08]MBL1210817.1 hypothetical protein [Geminocystis sp. GBBB08]
MNNTINKIVEFIESLSGEERYLLFEQLEKRRLLSNYEEQEENIKEYLEIVESDFGDYLPSLEDYEDRLAKGEIKW